MINIRDALLKDYLEIELHNYQKSFTQADVELYYWKTLRLGNPKTVIRDGKVIAIADMLNLDTHYLAWALVSVEVKNSIGIAKDFYRAAKRCLSLYLDKPALAHVLAKDKQAIRMIERLGFKRKEFLHEYYNGDDFWLYEKVA